MKTENSSQTAQNKFESLTEGQLKAIALLQFNSEAYTIEEIDGEIKIFIGEEYDEEGAIEIEEIDGNEERDGYIVLTDEEADEEAAENIKQTLWAFNASFLASETGFPVEIFEGLQGKYESANEAVEALIDSRKSDTNLAEFIEAAISADGRGHFMNSYDGNENEETVNGQTFYIYRMN
jgi:hypothetical protein